MLKNIDKLKKALGKSCKEGEPMSKHTTLKIGGPAKLFIEVKEEEELLRCLKLARKEKVDYLLIGGGSNLLVSDDGFDGLVIKNSLFGWKVVGSKVTVKSGTVLKNFIGFLIKKGFSGMEKMYGIPGTVGGAIYGNAGAYGQAISDCMVMVKMFDDEGIKWIPRKKCKFGYRDSVFKKNKSVILGAEFKFDKGLPKALKKDSLDILSMRSKKYPSSVFCPGSFFKNVLKKDLKETVLAKIPKEKIVYGKIPAGYLMEAVGAKCGQKGKIKIADYHGNLIINLGGGSASDFWNLAQTYARKVEKKFGIKLEPEVQLVGFR